MLIGTIITPGCSGGGGFKQYFNAVLRLIREYFAQMETSLSADKGCKN